MLQNRRLEMVCVAVATVVGLMAGPAWAEPAGGVVAAPVKVQAQTTAGATAQTPLPKWTRQASMRPFSQLAVTGKVSPLGIGVDLATPLGRHFNLRVGGNYFHYSDKLTQDGVPYQGRLSFTSGQVNLDWYPWAGGFHVSAGALVYDNSSVAGSGDVPGGTSFTVNGTNYVSSTTDPIHGNASITLAKSAPMVTVGWGNPLPRSGRRFSFPFEAGFAYVGDPTTQLNFAGTVCDSTGVYCESVTQYPGFASNVATAKAKLQKNANYARFYPVISMGFSFRF